MHRYEVAWRKAQVFDTAIKLFRAEARKKKPDFGGVAEKVTETHGKEVEQRHLRAIKEELANMAFALKTIRETKTRYGKTPAKLYHAIFGHPVKGVKLAGSDFSIAFVLPKNAYEKHYGRGSWGKANVNQIFAEVRGSREEALRRGVGKKLGVRQDYLRALSTVQKHDFALNPHFSGQDSSNLATAHEENHIISSLLAAHALRKPLVKTRSETDRRHARPHSKTGIRSPRPKFEEVFTETDYKFPRFPIAIKLVEYYHIFGTDREKEQHRLLEGVLRLTNSIKTEDETPTIPEVRGIRRISTRLKEIGIALPKLTGKKPPINQVTKVEEAAMKEAKRISEENIAHWRKKLNEIHGLKFDYGLSWNMLQMLVRTHNLDEVPKIIKWNMRRLEASQLNTSLATDVSIGRKKSPFETNS